MTRSFLIKPASSLCGLRCSYCFYHDVAQSRQQASYGVMAPETADALLRRALAEGGERDEIQFCFQGGEPTLAGLPWFRRFSQKAQELRRPGQRVSYAIQTNAMDLDEDWCRYFREHRYLVGVSLDGFQENHDFFRRTPEGEGTFPRVMAALELLKAHRVEVNILTVLTSRLGEKPQRLFRFYREQGFDHVQLIPCLPSLEGAPEMDRWALTPEGFVHFYRGFFDCWYEELQRGRYLSVTLFDNLIPLFLGVPPDQCGMLGQCRPQQVVEGDGAVYPCDFYVLDRYRCGNVRENTLRELEESPAAREFLAGERRSFRGCAACRWQPFCGGGCKRLNAAYFNDRFCAYQQFLDYAGPRMRQVAQALRQPKGTGGIVF